MGTKTSLYLLDVNVLIACIDEDHQHHKVALKWLETPGLQWALCAFAEAGVMRYATRIAHLDMSGATEVLDDLCQHPGYRYHPIRHDWRTLTKPFAKRLHGHQQVTDAYLLGLAIHDRLILATFDQALLHLAGEHSSHVHLLE